VIVGVDRVGVDFDVLYKNYWWSMLRLAQGLVDDVAAGQDVVQDAYAALYRRRASLHEPQAAVGYLRVSVVNASRSALRRRRSARAHLSLAREEHDAPADHAALLSAEHQQVRAALAALPERQREVLTLRYLADLSDAEIAEATGLSNGGVRSAASRGIAALRSSLGGQL
jgi:RNA polymerase sigma-70 factor (sigma-E family)